MFSGKLKCKWTGPFIITEVFPHGAVEMENNEGSNFTVNRQRIKMYLGHAKSVHEVVEAHLLDELRTVDECP